MGAISTRARDRVWEKFMQGALDEIYERCGFSVRRYDDSDHQLRGIDLELTDEQSEALYAYAVENIY